MKIFDEILRSLTPFLSPLMEWNNLIKCIDTNLDVYDNLLEAYLCMEAYFMNFLLRVPTSHHSSNLVLRKGSITENDIFRTSF